MSRLRRFLVPAAIGALLAGAGAAHGAVLIGSNLAAAATQSICTAGVACTYLQTLGGVPSATSPYDGVITSWRVKSGSAGGDATLRVIHSFAPGSYMARTASSATQTLALGLNSFPSRIPIVEEDTIGLDNATSALVFGLAGDAAYFFNPALTQFASGTPTVGIQSVGRELLVNATLEADEDGDEYGDESQDGCPTDQSRQTPPCAPAFAVTAARVSPTLLRTPIAASRRLYVRLTTTRPATVRVTVEALRRGRFFADTCILPNLSPGGNICLLAFVVRNTERDIAAGATTVAVKPRGLPVGVYRVTVEVTDQLGPGVSQSRFIVRIIRRSIPKPRARS